MHDAKCHIIECNEKHNYRMSYAHPLRLAVLRCDTCKKEKTPPHEVMMFHTRCNVSGLSIERIFEKIDTEYAIQDLKDKILLALYPHLR